MKILRKTCPVCGRINRMNEKIFYRDFRGMKDIVPFLKYDIYVCNNCGMIYAGNILESMPLRKYYINISKYERPGWSNSSLISYLDSSAAEYIIRNVSNTENKSMLDIGCGAGGMLSELKRMGWNDVYGLEPSLKNASIIKDKYNIHVYVGMLGEYVEDLEKKKFDLISMKAVLEHVINVKVVVRQMLDLLSSKGRIFIEVPDADRFYNDSNLYQEFSIEHVNFFNLNSLINLFNGFGLTIDSFAYNKAGSILSLWSRSNSNIERYLFKSNKVAEIIKSKLCLLNEKYYIWGAGTHTAMLYQLNLIDSSKVVGIIDLNPNYWGKYLYGHIVEGIQNINGKFPILISSKDSQNEIIMYIKENHLPNRVITLY